VQFDCKQIPTFNSWKAQMELMVWTPSPPACKPVVVSETHLPVRQSQVAWHCTSSPHEVPSVVAAYLTYHDEAKLRLLDTPMLMDPADNPFSDQIKYNKPPDVMFLPPSDRKEYRLSEDYGAPKPVSDPLVWQPRGTAYRSVILPCRY